jgi:hypothetical protein
VTRKSRREIEKAVDELDGDDDTLPDGFNMTVHEHPETGEWYADSKFTEGPLDKDDVEPVMIMCTSPPDDPDEDRNVVADFTSDDTGSLRDDAE